MNREVLTLRALQALLVIQIFIGVFSVVTLNVGRGVAVFASAALIYLGMKIINHLAAIQELLSYTTAQQPAENERVSVQTYLKQKREGGSAPYGSKPMAAENRVREKDLDGTIINPKKQPVQHGEQEHRNAEVGYGVGPTSSAHAGRHDVR